MSGRGIMARISGAGRSNSLSPRESILWHLEALLNARKGQSPACPDYGIVDIVDIVHGFPKAIGELQSSIRETILKYEPRLKNVRVRHRVNEDNILVLRFEITGQLAAADSRGLLRFETQVNAAGAFKVA